MKYSFITSKSWRRDVEAKNPRQAYRIALSEHETDQSKDDRGIFGYENFFGYITKSYYKYDRDGTTPIDRVFSL